MATRRDRGEGDRGFTLIELLVVMGILVTLIGLSIAGISAVQRRSKVKSCKVLIDALAQAVEQYASAGDFGDFPPTTLAHLGVRGNRTNEGSEALVRCLTTRDKDGPYFDFKDSDLQNQDGDKLAGGRDPTNSSIRAPELYEVVDPWGNPLIYYHSRDYRGGRDFERYTIGEDAGAKCVPEPTGKTGEYPQPTRFVIWSAGPNGVNENGGGDDVCSWK